MEVLVERVGQEKQMAFGNYGVPTMGLLHVSTLLIINGVKANSNRK